MKNIYLMGACELTKPFVIFERYFLVLSLEKGNKNFLENQSQHFNLFKASIHIIH